MVSNAQAQDSDWEAIVGIVVEWLQNSPNIMMDISFASWLDTDGFNLLNNFKVHFSKIFLL